MTHRGALILLVFLGADKWKWSFELIIVFDSMMVAIIVI